MCRLHLGCGDVHLDGWVNVDLRHTPATDVLDDVRSLEKFDSGTITEIYACHVLQHVGRFTYKDALKRWFQLLRPGGLLRISTPNFTAITAHYVNTGDMDSIVGLLHARQDYEYNVNRMSWDFKSLKLDLKSVGFIDVAGYDWRETDHAGIDDFSQAYLPHMDKGTGRLMSLNMEAYKP